MKSWTINLSNMNINHTDCRCSCWLKERHHTLFNWSFTIKHNESSISDTSFWLIFQHLQASNDLSDRWRVLFSYSSSSVISALAQVLHQTHFFSLCFYIFHTLLHLLFYFFLHFPPALGITSPFKVQFHSHVKCNLVNCIFCDVCITDLDLV